MNYTVQTHAESGSWACPDGRQSLHHVTSKQQAEDVLRDWADTVGRLDDERCAFALVWRGHLADTTDQYPEAELRFGPRMGIHWFGC